jgi:hypothetical protein
VLEASGAWLLAVLAMCGGIGWLYLLRDSSALAAGPHLRGALPLEELADRGAQPLLRMLVAWLPAGFAAGLALTLGTRMHAASVAIASGVLAFAILFATTAASEAVIHNERLSAHLGPALARSGLWGAVAFVIIGSLLAAAAAAARRARRPAASSSAGRASSSAA